MKKPIGKKGVASKSEKGRMPLLSSGRDDQTGKKKIGGRKWKQKLKPASARCYSFLHGGKDPEKSSQGWKLTRERGIKKRPGDASAEKAN